MSDSAPSTANGNGKAKPPKFAARGQAAQYIFEPTGDINVHELAQCQPLLLVGVLGATGMGLLALSGQPRTMAIFPPPPVVDAIYEGLPKGAKRHFRAVRLETGVVEVKKPGLVLPEGAK